MVSHDSLERGEGLCYWRGGRGYAIGEGGGAMLLERGGGATLSHDSLLSDCELVAFFMPRGLMVPSLRPITDALISSTLATGWSETLLNLDIS